MVEECFLQGESQVALDQRLYIQMPAQWVGWAGGNGGQCKVCPCWRQGLLKKLELEIDQKKLENQNFMWNLK